MMSNTPLFGFGDEVEKCSYKYIQTALKGKSWADKC